MKTFSVIVPTYNRPERLKACLAAIDQLAWPADDYEVIVVDDGSPQPVGEDVGSRGNVRVMRQPNAGPAAARNTGARAATGQLLAFTDDDCTPQADWLRVLARAFEEPQVSLAGGRLVNALPDDRYAAASQSITDYAYGLPSDGPRLFATANLACRATVFEAVSGFDESFPLAAGEDYDFCHRLQHAGHRAVYAPEAVVHHRHAMTLRGYVRQHFAYGRGLLAFRRRAAERSGETSARPQPLSFYSGLVMHPLKHGGGVVGAALVALSQAATAAGAVGSTLFTRGQTMRVLIVNDLGRAYGGAENMSLSLRDGLRQRGHQTHLFTSRAQSHPLPLLADSSCYGSFGPQRRALLVANPSARRQLARVVKEFRPDVVHVRMFLTQLSPLILPVLRDIPCVLHVVTYEMICPRGTKRLPNGDACRVRSGMACLKSRCVSPIKLMEHKVQQRMMGDLSVFDRIVANSGWTRRRLLADGVRCEESVSNGVPLRPRRPPLSGPPTIAYAGRLVAEKGVEMLLHVIHNVRERCPGATLLIAGEGPLEARLKALAGGLNLNGAVQFLGHRSRDQLEQVLASAWVQAVPSLWEEPFGIVAAEAMMRGTAVAASDHGGLAEQVISDGPDRTGTLLPAGDVEAWTSALLELLHDQPLCERLGAAGAVRARQSFSEARFLEGFEWIYAKVAAPIASISY